MRSVKTLFRISIRTCLRGTKPVSGGRQEPSEGTKGMHLIVFTQLFFEEFEDILSVDNRIHGSAFSIVCSELAFSSK